MLDAFSGDAIPVHLLTREAVKLYAQKIKSDGIIAFHISNWFLDLAPILEGIGSKLSMSVISRDDKTVSEQERVQGKYPSHWVLLAHSEDAFGSLVQVKNWEKLAKQKNIQVWTDDYSNILSVLR